VPPLRARSDVLDLADHLLAFFARQTGRRLVGFTPDARAALAAHGWPGNLRELRNVRRAGGDPGGRPRDRRGRPARASRRRGGRGGVPASRSARPVPLARVEAEHIPPHPRRAPNLDEAARILGIDPSTLYRKRKQIGL